MSKNKTFEINKMWYFLAFLTGISIGFLFGVFFKIFMS